MVRKPTNMKCVFLVYTPYQFLSAIEARHSLQQPDDECILVHVLNPDDKRAAGQIASMMRPSEWSRVEQLELENSKFKFRLNRRKIDRLFRTFGSMDRLYFASPSYYFGNHAAHQYKPAEVIILDDGTANQEVYDYRFGSPTHNEVVRVAKIWVYLLFFGIHFYPFPKLTFYSIYDLKLHPGDRLIRHDFRYLRSKMKSCDRDETVYFAGGCLVDLGIVSKENYFSWLGQIRDYFPGQRIVYVPHRLEAPERLKELAEAFKLEIAVLDVPMEVHFVGLKTLPGTLAGFYSTVFDSCQVLFQDQAIRFVAFEPRLEAYLDPRRRDFAEKIYAHYRKHYQDRMTVVPLR